MFVSVDFNLQYSRDNHTRDLLQPDKRMNYYGKLLSRTLMQFSALEKSLAILSLQTADLHTATPARSIKHNTHQAARDDTRTR
jgi:hypothetical protein